MTAENSSPSAADPLLAVRSDHRCFGCGARNPIGLHLAFTSDENGVRASFVPSGEHQGFENVIHGGIISAVLDEAMAWATATAGIWAVTADMRVRFRRPLHVGEPTTVTASISSTRGRLTTASAELTADADSALIASATASFMRVDKETEVAWRMRYFEKEVLEPGVDR
jgi:uncharacterized protein (TIGR00369 family)